MPNPRNMHYSDPCNVVNPDIFQFEYKPPEPYSLVIPRYEIEVGDIKCIAGEETMDQWFPVDDREAGFKVPHLGMIYARVEPPSYQYRVVWGDETIEQWDMMWRETIPKWEIWRGGDHPVTTAAELIIFYLENKQERVFFAKPDPSKNEYELLPLSEHHRDLYEGEITRRGDKRIFQGMDDWEVVAERGLGKPVWATTEANGLVRHCRPCSPNQQAWYVNLREGKGRANAIGSFDDPFDSLESVLSMIDATIEAGNTALHGVVFELDGTPLFVYDLPEPVKRRTLLNKPVSVQL